MLFFANSFLFKASSPEWHCSSLSSFSKILYRRIISKKERNKLQKQKRQIIYPINGKFKKGKVGISVEKGKMFWTTYGDFVVLVWGFFGSGFFYLFVCFPEDTCVIYSVPDAVCILFLNSLSFSHGTQVPTMLHKNTIDFPAASNFQLIS